MYTLFVGLNSYDGSDFGNRIVYYSGAKWDDFKSNSIYNGNIILNTTDSELPMNSEYFSYVNKYEYILDVEQINESLPAWSSYYGTNRGWAKVALPRLQQASEYNSINGISHPMTIEEFEYLIDNLPDWRDNWDYNHTISVYLLSNCSGTEQESNILSKASEKNWTVYVNYY